MQPSLQTRRHARPSATLDHLVIAAATLADGIDHVAALTGAVPVVGGSCPEMGTHSAFLRLAGETYLEIVAIDPDAPRPRRPRWLGLDAVAVQAELQERPRLAHWVARVGDVDAALAASAVPLGRVLPLAQGEWRFRLAVTDDGRPPGHGILPALIQWDSPAYPAAQLPASGVSLAQLAAAHPEPAPLRAAIAALGLEGTIAITYGREARLAAMLRTPRGMVTF